MRVLTYLLISCVSAQLVAPVSLAADLAKRHEGHEDAQSSAQPTNGADSHDAMSDMEMTPSPASMNHHHGRKILDDPNLEPQQRKYWEQYSTLTFFSSQEGSKFWLWAHAILATVAYGLMAPLSLLTASDRRTQWFYIPFQTAQSCLGLLSLLCFAIYSATAPKLYPNNCYSRFSIALVVLESSRWFAVILRAITNYMRLDEHGMAYARAPTGDDDLSFNRRYNLNEFESARRMPSLLSSTEEGTGTDTELSSFDIDRSSEDPETPNAKPEIAADDDLFGHQHRPAGATSGLIRKLAHNRVFAKLNAAVGGLATFFFYVLNYPMFLVGYAYLLIGLATAFLMGKGHNVFALTAHFIKGFVFFLLGFIELARFLGAGASRGWGWNEVRVAKEPKSGLSQLYIVQCLWPAFPTVEFLQSFLIFFYGITNVFLEHLGNNDGGMWSHKDLQHVSIAFMFFGGGLCGMVLESKLIQDLVSQSFNLRVVPEEDEGERNFVRRSWSRNPMPALVIFWTGALMSHHEQETALSTAIHIQWGTMLSLGAVFRLLTLLLLSTRPRAKSAARAAQPPRPFTELVVAFLLICGGMIFMSSNRETVEGELYRGMDQMFTLNVSVGVTVLLMAFFVGCVAVKGWACARY